MASRYGLLLGLSSFVEESAQAPVGRFVYIINGQDRSVRVRKGSVRWVEELGSRNVGRIDLEYPLATTTVTRHGVLIALTSQVEDTQHYPALHGHTISIVDSETAEIVFAGRLRRPVRVPLGLSHVRYECEMVDWSEILDRRLVAATYDNMTAGAIVRDIVQNYVNDEGLTVAGVEDGPTLRRVTFNYRSAKVCFDELTRLSGYSYWIDVDRDLKFTARASVVAPFELEPGVVFDTRVVSDVDEYRNAQYLRAGVDLTDARSETFVGDGERRTFTLEFPVGAVPIHIKVNTVAKTVGIRGVETGKQFYWNKGVNEISQDSSQAVLTTSDTLEVRYRGEYPIIVYGQLDEEIAARAAIETGSGRYETRDDDASIDDDEVAIDKVDALLARHGLIADTVTTSTHQSGLRAGQLVTFTHEQVGLGGLYLIERIEARVVTPHRIEYRINAVGGNSIGAWQAFFIRLAALGADRPPRDNEVLITVRSAKDAVRVADVLTDTTGAPDVRVGSRCGFMQVTA